MLTSFRNIRKSLVDSSSVRRYILYAIGEILLVMIGILLALQVNNWNEWRQERIVEKEILQSLKDNLELNIEALRFDIDRLTRYNQSAQITLSVLNERLPFEDSLSTHFHNARVPKRLLKLSQSGYEQYKNAGYNIILNRNLKDNIIHYFESTFPNWYVVYSQVNEHNKLFIDYHVPLFKYSNSTLEPIDIYALYDDNYFLGWLRAYMGGRNSLIKMETDFIDETLKILQLINRELGEE